MARITVLGGSGYAGGAIVAEAAKRGHEVTSVSRTAVAAPVAGVEYAVGSALDPAVLDAVTAGRDVVVVALSPRGDMAVGWLGGRRGWGMSAARRRCWCRRAGRGCGMSPRSTSRPT